MRKLVYVSLALLLCGTGLGCDLISRLQPGVQNDQDKGKKEYPKVQYTVPVTDEITDYEEFIGRTEAVFSIEVRARDTGYLDKVHFQDGTEVKEGDLLFEIDPRPYKADLNRAEASVLQSEAHQKRLEADQRRASNLFVRGAISREEFDKISGDYAEAEAAVGIARANRDLARLNLAFTKVAAPITGRLSRRLVDPGNLVKADETVLTTMVSLDPMHVYFDIDERTLLHLRRLVLDGKIKTREEAAVPVEVALADEDDFPHKGTINFSDNKVDSNTGTLRVRGVIANPAIRSLSSRVFSPGMFVRVRLQIGTPHQAVLVSEQSLVSEQGQKFVYVVNDESNDDEGRVQAAYKRFVKVGKLKGNLRIVENGLQPGEKVVVSGLQRIREGGRRGDRKGTLVELTGEQQPAVASTKNVSLESDKSSTNPSTGGSDGSRPSRPAG